jgi:hypothetical protein
MDEAKISQQNAVGMQDIKKRKESKGKAGSPKRNPAENG